MKETGTTHWLSPNTSATNDSGFNGTPTGYRGPSAGAFNDLGKNGNYWSGTTNGNSFAWARILNYNDAKCDLAFYGKAGGFAVRLIKE